MTYETAKIEYQAIIGDEMRDFIIELGMDYTVVQPDWRADNPDDYYGYTEIDNVEVLECIEVLECGEKITCLFQAVEFSDDDLQEMDEMAFEQIKEGW